MRVGVECLDRTGMPESSLNSLDALVMADQQRGVVVPQCMKPVPAGIPVALTTGRQQWPNICLLIGSPFKVKT